MESLFAPQFSFQCFGLPFQQALLYKNLLGDREHHPFQKILKLPTSLIPTAANFTKLLNRFTTTDESGHTTFDWASFRGTAAFTRGLQVVNSTNDKDFTMEEYHTIVALAEEVVRYIKNNFSADVPGIHEEIVNVMTNLKVCKENGFATFYQSEDKKNSGFQFNSMFATNKTGFDDHFYGLVTTIKVEAEEKTEMWWWGLGREHTEKFCCTLNAMEVMISENFS